MGSVNDVYSNGNGRGGDVDEGGFDGVSHDASIFS